MVTSPCLLAVRGATGGMGVELPESDGPLTGMGVFACVHQNFFSPKLR